MARYWFIGTCVILVAALVAAALFWAENMNSTVLSEEAAFPISDADLEMQGIEYVQTKEGNTEWRLSAQSAQFLKDKNTAELENVHVTFFPKSGRHLIMTADKGRLNPETKNIQVWGKVTVTSDDGFTFKAPAVRYLSQEKQIVSVHKVVFSGPRIQVTGKGMRASIEGGKLKLLEKVTATLIPDKEKGELKL